MPSPHFRGGDLGLAGDASATPSLPVDPARAAVPFGLQNPSRSRGGGGGRTQVVIGWRLNAPALRDKSLPGVVGLRLCVGSWTVRAGSQSWSRESRQVRHPRMMTRACGGGAAGAAGTDCTPGLSRWPMVERCSRPGREHGVRQSGGACSSGQALTGAWVPPSAVSRVT